MKLIHLSDLHIGKWVNGYSLLEDQKYILNQILNIIDEEHPDAVIIAGDVYDKPVPSAEAVEVFDDFLVKLSKMKLEVFVISGNHDSPERLGFGSRIMDAQGIHISMAYYGKSCPVVLQDEYGSLTVYMLPFIKPAAVAAAISLMNPDFSRRNILIAHQFVTGALRSDSEEIRVGGLDNVDASVFEGFDYVALGHIHRPQDIKTADGDDQNENQVNIERIRYCGSPLKYSFSESKFEKSVTVAELAEKGKLNIRTVPLKPLHEMVELKGKYDDITSRDFYSGTSWQEDYVHITLTDENDILNAASRLQSIYHNLMKLDYDNARTRQNLQLEKPADMDEKSPFELFSEFYESQNALPMSSEQEQFVEGLIEKIWEGSE